MKNVRKNDKLWENKGAIHTKLLISHLLITLENQTGIKVMLRHGPHSIWRDEKNYFVYL